MAAGRAFLRAVGIDLATLWLRLRLRLATKRSRMMRPARAAAPRRSFRSSSGRVVRRFAIMITVLTIVGTVTALGAMLWALHDLPLDQPIGGTSKPAILLEAANGEPLGRVGPMKVAAASREDFPERLVKAVLSIEDRRFYEHYGIDPWGIARALRRNMAAGEIVEGGSTITQQLVKMQLLGNDRTLVRKLREAFTAIWLEMRLGKDEILTRYLNSLYMGAGAHGMAAAARLYFDKPPADLTLAEAAMLAGLIRAPSQYNPLRDLEAARERAAVVLDAMVDNGVLSPEEADKAKAHPAVLKLAPEATQAGSWFADWAAKEASDLTGPSTQSLRLQTTLVPELQRLAERVINEALAAEGSRADVSQAALVALRSDGAVLAMVGGRDYRQSQFNRAIEANRQPGSAFKLFVYLAALRNGYLPHDTIDAGPVEINGWRPENFGERDYGRMSLADAFTRSINTAAVRLAMDVGLDEVIAAARDLGIDAQLSAHPSLALGAVGVSLLDLTGAFASVRAGRTVEPWGIAAFGADDSSRMRTVGPPVGRSLGPHSAQMIELLRQVVEHGTGRGAALDGFAAGKTGTSQNHRDAWFIGFNDALTVGVWVGNDDNSPTRRVVGGTLPATIWRRFVTEATGLLGHDNRQMAREPGWTPAQGLPIDAPMQQASSETTGVAVDAIGASEETTGFSEAPMPAQCDYQACADAYRSFRASDCTYQPYSGPRRLCTRGDVETGQPEQASPAFTSARSQQCNIDVCSRFYRSFDATDCTYQPYGGGPRQICER